MNVTGRSKRLADIAKKYYRQLKQYKKINKEYRNILESITDGFFTLDQELRITYMNKASEQMFLYPHLMLGKRIWEIEPRYIDSTLHHKFLKARDLNLPVHFEICGKNSNRWFEVTIYPSKDFFSVYFRIITDKKQSEEALRISEERFSKAFNASPNPMAITTLKDGIYIDVNESFILQSGYSREEIIGNTSFNLNIWFDPEDHKKAKKELLEQGRHRYFKAKVQTKEGKILTGLFSAEIIEINKEKYILTVFNNITSLMEAEEALRISEERFSKAFRANPNPMGICTLKGEHIDVNGAMLKVTGYRKNEVIGNSVFKLDLFAKHNELKETIKQLATLSSIRNKEFNFRTKTGENRTGLLSAEVISLNKQKCVLYTLNDITDRKKLEKELSRLDQLNLIGQMAAGIGHEIRNPLTSVRGFLQMLGAKEDCSKYREYFSLMIDELDRANSIITEYLSLTRKHDINKEPRNLNTIIESLYPLIQADAMNLNKNVLFEKGDIPDNLLNEKEIRQLILNLVRNGFDAMEAGKVLTIRTYLDESIVLEVEDQGQGIPDEILDKLGTPFLTTKPQGTGLGLATCFSIASRHNATIEVKSKSSGAIFNVKFPLEA